MKKHWIYIKRGLSEDPKHREAMGECIWLYMHIIDRADWETGIAYGWKDEQEAADMGMNVRTLREQRRKLDELDYISCAQKQYSQDIIIRRWIDPRNYSGKVLNQGDVQMEPQGYTQGYTQGSSQDVTPTLDSKTKSKAAAPQLSETEKAVRDLSIENQIYLGKLQVQHSRTDEIKNALRKYFRLTPRWSSKFDKQWLEWALDEDITPQQIKYAAELWRSDKRFNWSPPNLKGIAEHWDELKDESVITKPMVDEKRVMDTLHLIEEKHSMPFVPRPQNVERPQLKGATK